MGSRSLAPFILILDLGGGVWLNSRSVRFSHGKGRAGGWEGDRKTRSWRFGEENLLRTALFWAIAQRVMANPYGHFGTTYLSYLERSIILGSSWIFGLWRRCRQVVPKRR